VPAARRARSPVARRTKLRRGKAAAGSGPPSKSRFVPTTTT
jgi:hypothetical protein